MEQDLDAAFERIVAPLVTDRGWRRRVRWARATARAGRAGAVLVTAAGRGLGQVGACFVGAPSAAWADVPTATIAPR